MSARANWRPDSTWFETTNLASVMRRLGASTYDAFLDLSVRELEHYWAATLEHLNIVFDPPPSAFIDLGQGKPWARFFPGAGFNFAAQCLLAPKDGADRAAVRWEEESGRSGELSYTELAARTRCFASGLRKLGVARGDRVGLMFPNSPEAVIAFLAVCYMGAICVPLYTGFGPEAVARRLMDAGARYLLVGAGFQRRGAYVSLASIAQRVCAQIPGLRAVVQCDENDAPVEFGHVPWRSVEESGDASQPAAATAATDPCFIIYTSGTTGKPKGAVHVHAGFPLRVAQDVAFVFDFKPNDCFFWMSDMGWMVGPFSICASLLNKGTLALYSGAPDRPDVGRLRSVAARLSVTHFGSSPTALRGMAANESAALRADAPDIRILMTGGEVMDEETHHWYFDRFGAGRAPVINYSGGTEVSGAIATNVLAREIAPSRFNSTAPGVDAVVLDDTGRKAATGVVGELAILTPFVGMTQGFWGDAARYLDTYWSRFPGVWVHGDLAVEEDDGQILLIGRSDDVMKLSGRRVGPAEVEAAIVDGAAIAEAVAFGAPDARSGEVLIVLVVRGAAAPNDDALKDEVVARVRASMGPAFRPSAVVPVSRLVKTRNGKLVRRLARQAWLGEAAGDLSAIEDSSVFDELAGECAKFREVRAE